MQQKIKNYFKYWQYLGQLKFNLAMKLSLVVTIVAFIVSGFIVYFSAKQLKQEKYNFINKELAVINNELGVTLASYTTMLELIEEQVQQNNDVFWDPITSTKEIMQIYLRLENQEDKTKIGFTDIIWQDTVNNFTVNKYGKIGSLNFQPTIIEYLKEDTKHICLTQKTNDISVFNLGEFYLLKGIWTKEKQYLGQIILKLDFLLWWQALANKLNEENYKLLMIDDQQKILLSSFSEYRKITKDELNFPLSAASNSFAKPTKYLNHYFTKSVKLENQPYFILIGYDKSAYKQELLAKIKLPILLCLGTSLLFIAILIIYGRLIRSEVSFDFKDSMNQLIEQNQIYDQEKQKIDLNIAEQEKLFLQEKRKYEMLISGYEIALREKNKLEKHLIDNLFSKLTEVRENLWILIKAQEVRFNEDPKLQKQALILTKLHEQLAHLTEFCIFEEEEKAIDLNALIEDCLNVFAKELSQLEIHLEVMNLHERILCNELLLRQVMVNLLKESIYFSRNNGTLEIIPALQKNKDQDELNIIVKDNGYGISNGYDRINKKEIQHSIIPLDLNINKLTKMVEFLGGKITINQTIDQGKIIKLIFPIKKVEN